MCGIAGIFALDGDKRIEVEEVMILTRCLQHRGPDAQGIWISQDRRVALGHARLSILDLSHEAGQPMKTVDERYVIVFNGEIYNFVELADELKIRGYSFRTQSDTEVLLYAWDCWREEMFPRLNGMWALAIHDNHSGKTLLSRDRFGVKPLYYHLTEERLIFASEVQAIDKVTGGRMALDAGYFQGMLRLETGEASYLEDVKALLPGFHMSIGRDGRFTCRRWYQLAAADVPGSFSDQAAGLKELVIDACRARLRSDVPIATCLSGGIDSGAIVSLLHAFPGGESRFPGFNHRSFTAAFPGTELDETGAARALAKDYDLDLNLCVMECPDASELEMALGACDGPMPTLAFYPIWKLYQHVRRQGVVVTMDGMGPDEMLGGYYLGRDSLRGAWHMKDPRWFYDLYRTYGSLYDSGSAWIRADLKQVLREKGAGIKQPLKKLLSRSGCGTEVQPSRAPQLAPLPIWVPEDHPMRDNPMARALWHQFFAGPLPFFLNQYDRCSMANGVECRMPFMDYRVVEYIFSLPLQSRVGNGFTKRVLREAVRDILPDTIRLNRRKTGFNAPFKQWLQGPLKEWALDISATTHFIQNPCFDGSSLSAMLRRNGGASHDQISEREIWPALHLAWWMSNRGSN